MRRAPFGFTYTNGHISRSASNWHHARLLVELAIQHELTYSLIVNALPASFPWRPTRRGFRFWLSNPTLRGGVGHHVPGSHRWAKVEWGQGPALISVAEWRVIKQLLSIRGQQPRRDQTHLFSRLIQCRRCSRHFRWNHQIAHYIGRTAGCQCHGAQLEEGALRAATIAALARRAAPRLAKLAMEWANHQSENECYELRACRDRLAQLESLQIEGVTGLNIAICQLRDQIVALSPDATSDASMVYECLLRDPATLANLSNDALRKILLEFAVEIHYIGDGFRVSVGHLN